jgi:hypothetical protein
MRRRIGFIGRPEDWLMAAPGAALQKMFGFMTMPSQPNTQARWKIHVDKKLHLLSRISRWAA